MILNSGASCQLESEELQLTLPCVWGTTVLFEPRWWERRGCCCFWGLQCFGFWNNCGFFLYAQNCYVWTTAIKARLSQKLGLTLGPSWLRVGGVVRGARNRSVLGPPGCGKPLRPHGRSWGEPGRATAARLAGRGGGGAPPLPWWHGAPVGSSVEAGGAGRGDVSGHAVASARELRGGGSRMAAAAAEQGRSATGAAEARRGEARGPPGLSRLVGGWCHGSAAVTVSGGHRDVRRRRRGENRRPTALSRQLRRRGGKRWLGALGRRPGGLLNASLGTCGGGVPPTHPLGLRSETGSHPPSRHAWGRGDVWNQPLRARCWVGAPGEVTCVHRWWVTRKQLLMPLQGIRSEELKA